MLKLGKYILAGLLLIGSQITSATDYYVSSSGNDANNGISSSTPWKTIAKVNSTFINMQPGDRILFNRGEIFYGSIIVSKSGIAGSPITISAYGSGANPVISGFVTMSSWTNEGGSIYSKTVSLESSSYNIVTVNGVNTAMGRWPNSGTWNTVDAISGTTQLTDAALNAGTTNWTGAEVVVRPDEYRIERVKITNHVSQTLYHASLSEGAIIGNGYFIQNDLRTLDATNEWYYDGTKFYIYGDPATKTVNVSGYIYGIIINSFDYITFDNLNITGYGADGFSLTDASNITIQNCNISYCGENAIKGNDETGGISNNCSFSNNTIDQINSNGIYLKSQFTDSYIGNNTITNIGLITGAAHGALWDIAHEGIALYSQWGNTGAVVEYNTLRNIGYIGILMFGTNITVRYNYINNFCLKLNDGGGIYTWALVADPSTRVGFIRNNIVLNGIGNHDMTAHNKYNDARGIYLDDFTKGTTVDGNTVAYCNGANLFIRGGINCNITNNTVYGDLGTDGNIYLQEFSNTVEVHDNLKITYNKFISKAINVPVLTYQSGYGTLPASATLDYNYYARPIDDNKVFHLYNPSDNGTNLAGWQAYTGKEANSHKSCIAIADTAQIHLNYNATKADKIIALSQPMIDITGAKFATSITLAPYTSAVLMVDPNPSVVIPVYVSSAVENVTPALLSITYNTTLANIVPAASSFTVKVNSVVRTVNSVTVSGTNVQLTLATPVVFGDVISIDYTKPATNPLQTSSGGQAASFFGQSVTNRVASPALPTYVSSSIQNATPGLLVMVYNLTLANIVPSISAFTVKVGPVVRAVTSVSVSGTNVQLTLEYPVGYSDVITVDYTKPAINPLQTSSGSQAASIVAQPVTNNVGDALPLLVSSSIENATPGVLTMVYNQALANIVPATSAFTVKVGPVVRAVTSVSVSGTNVQLTLEYPVGYSDVITVDYTKPATNPLQTSSGGQAVSIVGQNVTNRVAAPIIPTYVNSSIQKVTPNLLVMVYNQPLANIVPAISAFTVKVNSAVRPLNSIYVSGTNVQLTLSYQVVSGDVITIDYVKPATNPLQSSGGIAATIFNQLVTNNCTNSVPSVTLTSPITNSSFTAPASITISAIASDPDGSITLVEFYNGTTKLGSTSSAPYSFTWNNVAVGNYYLTAKATDNLNAKSTSASTYISVKNRYNKHPYVRLLNPTKGNTYENLSSIPMEAIASDSDGVVTKVEFINGSEKLGEATSAPYMFTWKNVPSGTYSITAIATDDSNDTSASAPVVFEVGKTGKNDTNFGLVTLYPNPNDGHFSVEFASPLKNDKYTIVIIDLAGKQIANEPVSIGETSKQFNISNDVKSGIYVMVFKENKGIYVTKKFIIH